MFKTVAIFVIGFLVLCGLVVGGVVVTSSLGQSWNVGPLAEDALPDPWPDYSEAILTIGGAQFTVATAANSAEKERGLQFVEEMPADAGVVFIFYGEQPSPPVFWMKNTLIPLDIIWVANGRVVDMRLQVPTEIGVTDEELTRYTTDELFSQVVELHAGTVDTHNIAIGDLVELSYVE